MPPVPTIWMNVSTSVAWKRPPVGIVRVEQELCRHLKAIFGDRFKMCILRNSAFKPYTGYASNGEIFPLPESDFTDRRLVDFPESVSLEPVLATAKKADSKNRSESLPADVGPADGDILISVGLDWDWEHQGLTKVLYDLSVKKGVKVVTCCYDLTPILFPSYCLDYVSLAFSEYVSNITRASSLVLCISKRTERDYKLFCQTVRLPAKPTVVIPLGTTLPESAGQISSVVEKLANTRFILYVSTIERRKNHNILYQAYRLLAQSADIANFPKLVFVGMPGWGVGKLLDEIKSDECLKNSIIQLNHVTDPELRVLYKQCEFFVYPSFYEGWGLPISEALAFGKPVIASACGSIPEVGGGLVEYIDPRDAAEWASAISRLARDPDERSIRSKMIRDRYSPKSWEDAAEFIREQFSVLFHLDGRMYG